MHVWPTWKRSKRPTLFVSSVLTQSSRKALAPPPAGAAGLGAQPSKGAMPHPLPDEILEEVLRRLPPHEPAELVRAALVSRRWCRVVSDPGFRRRFREFHRSSPLLGMLCNFYNYDTDDLSSTARFVPTTALCTPRKTFRDMSVLDARHGRVLLCWHSLFLLVWDPIADKVRQLHFPQEERWVTCWNAAVLCSAAGAGACDHLECHTRDPSSLFLCAATKMATPPSTPTHPMLLSGVNLSALSKNTAPTSASGWKVRLWGTLYFRNGMGSTALKYDLGLCQVSLVLLPSVPQITPQEMSLLTTMDDGGLGFVNIDDSKLYIWSRKDTPEVDAKWESRVIELKTVFPVDVAITKLGVTGSGVGIIFMRTEDEVYTIDLKTYEVKKVYKGTADKLIPYMSFYTPALEEVTNQVQVAQVHDKPKVLMSKVLGQGN